MASCRMKGLRAPEVAAGRLMEAIHEDLLGRNGFLEGEAPHVATPGRSDDLHVDGRGVLADAVAASCSAGQLCIFDAEGSLFIPRRSPEGLEIFQAAQRCVDRVNLERRHQQRWGAYTGNPPEQYGTTSAVSDGWRLLQTATDRLQFQPVEEAEPAASSRDAAQLPQPPIEEAEPAESSRDDAPRGPPRI